MTAMRDTANNFCAILFDVLEGQGIRDVVCSPGTRNAPLLIAAAARDGLRKHVVVDERSAAFMALGMANVSRRPVALICTSGTAMLNYTPAVAEAYYQGVPLVVITADRPEQWIDQDDSQTLRQFEAMRNFVKKSYELPAWGMDDDEMKWFANRVANDACIECKGGRPGPVHINVRVAEPVAGITDRLDNRNVRLIERVQADIVGNRETIKELGRELAGARVLFVAGFAQPSSKLHRAAAEFCNAPNVVGMTETLSNIHLGNRATDIDAVLTAYSAEELDRLAPDIVVSTGGSLVSRMLKEYLRRNSGRCRHWAIGPQNGVVDCFQSMTKIIDAKPSRVLHALAVEMKKNLKNAGEDIKDYSRKWSELRAAASVAKHAFVDSLGWCELTMFRHLMETVNGKGLNLFLSNGTTVRYAQLFGADNVHSSYSNRGVSGIDGCTSTAIGCAKAYKGITLLVTGDMSASYDLGGLALPDIPETMRILVVDNNGGGIFRFIRQTNGLEEREQYFCAPPKLPLRSLAEGYGWDYIEADDMEEFRIGAERLLDTDRKTIMRVVVDGEESAHAIRKYMTIKAGERGQ